jgi:hypothetical protein
MTQWYIDSLDARGGFAFASRRERDPVDNDTSFIDAEQTVFMAPPYFVAEPIASRATALSARRGAFQSGLYIDGVEYAFDAVDEIQEFVRRAWLGTGSTLGDDGGAPGAALPPSPPELPLEGLDVRLPPHATGPTAATTLVDAFAEFDEAVGETKSPARRLKWKSFDSGVTPSPIHEPLVSATSRCARELLMRRSASGANEARWAQSWSALVYWARRLGTWRDLGLQTHNIQAEATSEWPCGGVGYEMSLERTYGDPFQTLRLIPIRRNLGELLGMPLNDPGRAHVAALVARVSASPRKIDAAVADEVAELFFFAACMIASVDTRIVPPPILFVEALRLDWHGVKRVDAKDVAEQSNAALRAAALAWCRRSLPRYSFMDALEQAIAASPATRYAGPPPTTAVSARREEPGGAAALAF